MQFAGAQPRFGLLAAAQVIAVGGLGRAAQRVEDRAPDVLCGLCTVVGDRQRLGAERRRRRRGWRVVLVLLRRRGRRGRHARGGLGVVGSCGGTHLVVALQEVACASRFEVVVGVVHCCCCVCFVWGRR